MKIAVRYFSKSGNTKKLAEAVGRTLGVKVFPITQPVDHNTDILFLGSSVYAGGVSSDVKEFIKGLHETTGTVVNISSAALIESTYKQVKKLVEARGIKMSDKEYHCKGRFTLLHKGRPNNNDITEVSTFADEFIKTFDV